MATLVGAIGFFAALFSYQAGESEGLARGRLEEKTRILHRLQDRYNYNARSAAFSFNQSLTNPVPTNFYNAPLPFIKDSLSNAQERGYSFAQDARERQYNVGLLHLGRAQAEKDLIISLSTTMSYEEIQKISRKMSTNVQTVR